MDLPRGDQSYNVQKKKELSESLLEMILDTKFTDVAQILKGQNLELIEELVCKDPYILHKVTKSIKSVQSDPIFFFRLSVAIGRSRTKWQKKNSNAWRKI